jgi:alpha-L-fucosidase
VRLQGDVAWRGRALHGERHADQRERVVDEVDPPAAAADRALHRLIADLAGNSMLGALADVLVRLDTHVAAWREALQDGGAAQALHADHAAIILALRTRDPEAARARADAESSPHDGDGEPDPFVNQPFAEWYQNSLAIEGSPVWHYHRATYGSRGYQSFRGPFASMLGDWDPAAWAELFGAAGARYAIQVAKHHDGFLLWPSGHPHPHRADWAVQRDLISDVAAAVRGAGLRYGIYYSSGVDWSLANLPIRRLVDAHASCPPGAQYAGYVDAHWRELLDWYEPSVLWNDMGHPRCGTTWATRAVERHGPPAPPRPAPAVPRLLPEGARRHRQRQVHDRRRPAGPAITTDVETPNFARRYALRAGAWEMVRPVGISFGWNRQEGEEHTLSGEQLIRLLIDVISKDGNLLLGVSPDDRGQVPQLQQRSLRALGAWLERHGEAVYGTRPWTHAESTTVDGVPVRFTTKDGDLYVHLLGATGRQVVIDGLYLQFRSRVHDLTAGRAVQHIPGRHGAVLDMPELLNPAPVRVLRIHPCPPPIDG